MMFVFAPINKAANNVVVVWRKYYIDVNLKEWNFEFFYISSHALNRESDSKQVIVLAQIS